MTIDATKMARREVKTITAITAAYGGNTEEIVRKLRDTVKELQDAVKELQTRKMQAAQVGLDGWPQHAQECPQLAGQFLRLLQEAAAPTLVTVNHGLGRRPQGALWVKTTGLNLTLINGRASASVPPSTSSVVVFELNGAINEEHICILF